MFHFIKENYFILNSAKYLMTVSDDKCTLVSKSVAIMNTISWMSQEF